MSSLLPKITLMGLVNELRTEVQDSRKFPQDTVMNLYDISDSGLIFLPVDKVKVKDLAEIPAEKPQQFPGLQATVLPQSLHC